MPDQSSFNLSAQSAGPVECLGHTFPSDDVRREHYLKLLATKLKDPDFRKIEGFPIGTDEAILSLSDPPYYTACPNPWIGDFVKHHGTPYDPKTKYHREPFTADVREGKNHPIYNAHSYHTKVPHQIIMRYILHYTNPGEAIADVFCGTGMTGVAARLCGDRNEVASLGYTVLDDGTILNELGVRVSKLGPRFAILTDIGAAATSIANGFNVKSDPEVFESEAQKALSAARAAFHPSFTTSDPSGHTRDINYTIWSDVFFCGQCGAEMVFWDVALSPEEAETKDRFRCVSCGAMNTRKELTPAKEQYLDPIVGELSTRTKQVPVVINYTATGERSEKKPDAVDLEKIRKAESIKPTHWVPIQPVPDGYNLSQPKRSHGVDRAYKFFSARNLNVLAALREQVMARHRVCPALIFWFTSSLVWTTRLNRLLVSNYFNRKGGVIGQTLQGTLYISSIGIETNGLDRFGLRIKSAALKNRGGKYAIGTQSAENIPAPDNSLDYIFIDPPFGGNFMYSDVNFIWESWLDVFTNTKREAIENPNQGKDLNHYRGLMEAAFKEAFRVLKPGRWMTVEFSNTKASVWNSIQTALQESGFVVANVSGLEKTHKGFKAVTTSTAVKQDLVISAYKPNGGLEERFAKTGSTVAGVWDFIRTHLRNLPIVKAKGGQLEPIAERDPRILYDRMVAFYVGHSTLVPLSSAEFQAELGEHFVERDGMWFLPEQVNEYDKKRSQMENVGQLAIFVEDERSAIDWLRKFLKDRPSTYNDIQPEFLQQLNASWKKWEARPELNALLDQSFLSYDGNGEVPSQIHSYLSTQFKELRNLAKDHAQLRQKGKERWYVPDPKKNVDVETLRNKRLLEEFWSYLPDGYLSAARSPDRNPTLSIPGLASPLPKVPRSKKLKQVRTEAVRVGFKYCYQQKDYPTILAVADMLPESVLNEDEQLQMLYDNAALRAEATT
jgi:DNA modification methylase